MAFFVWKDWVFSLLYQHLTSAQCQAGRLHLLVRYVSVQFVRFPVQITLITSAMFQRRTVEPPWTSLCVECIAWFTAQCGVVFGRNCTASKDTVGSCNQYDGHVEHQHGKVFVGSARSCTGTVSSGVVCTALLSHQHGKATATVGFRCRFVISHEIPGCDKPPGRQQTYDQ